MANHPPEMTQRFHGSAEQQANALVGDPPNDEIFARILA
jgi:hypothetical protein